MKIHSAIYSSLAFIALCATSAVAADQTAKNGPNEASSRIAFYEVEGASLSPAELYTRIEKQRTILRLKNQGWAMDEDTYKGAGYANALQAKRNANDPAAAYYFGMHNSHICGGLEAGGPVLSDAVTKCLQETMESFKVASNGGIAAASFNIGQMYAHGWRVQISKFAAADWFVKAAKQYDKNVSRDDVLTAVEAALQAVPDHPGALRLKAELVE